MYSYVLVTDHEGRRMVQYHVQRLDPFPGGLFRVHYGFIGPDTDSLRPVGPRMLQSADRTHTIALSDLERR
ncbi:MAG: hypothetical protein KC668_08190 [Myxococcales bacterium]|nr:hypothetical protein [Myxococcales bacterium]